MTTQVVINSGEYEQSLENSHSRGEKYSGELVSKAYFVI